jgi:hypothetical protein
LDLAGSLESRAARVTAGFIALIAFGGLVVQFCATLSQTGSILQSLWTILFYFTVLTNLLVAIVMAGIAFDRPAFRCASLVGGTTLAILLVGVIYSLLLRGLLHLSGGAKVADFIMHYVVPVLVPLYWLAFVPKGRLKRRDPFLWCLYPLGYLGYALVRGAAAGKYPYPFLDVAKLGWPATLLNAAAIAIGFVIAAWALFGLNRWWGRRSGPADRSPAGDQPAA